MTVIKEGTQDIAPISENAFKQKIADRNKPQEKPAEAAAPAEIKTEAPQAKVEETKPEAPKEENKGDEKPKRKSIKETLKPFQAKKPDTITDEVEIPEPLKAKFSDFEKKESEYKKQLEDYKKQFEDTDYQILQEAKKSGKDIFDILKEVQGVDPKSVPAAELWENYLKTSGVEGDELGEAMSDFYELKGYEQNLKVKDLREDLSKNQSVLKQEFLNKLKNGAQAEDLKKQKDLEVLVNADKEFKSLADSYIGQEHMGVTGTPEMATSLKNFNLGEFLLKKDGSGIDASKYFALAHHLLFSDLVLDTLENQIGADKFDEYKKEVEVTSGASKSIVRAPQGDQKTQSAQEVREHIHANMKPVSIGHPSVRMS